MTDIKDIPEGWELKKLGDVVKTTSGGTPSRKTPRYYSGDIPWVKSGELDKGIIYYTEEKITDDAVKNSSAKVFPKGTLLIALYGATIGKLAFLGIEAATNQAVCGIFENDKIELKYIYNFLYFNKSNLIKQGIGGAQPNISQTILKNLEIPLPTIEVQKAIVSKIEELFSELDKGIAELKLAQEQLKVYRQSVLKKYIGNGDNFVISSVIEKMDQGWSPKCENEASTNENEWAVIKTTAIQSGNFVEDANKRLPKNLVPKTQHEIVAGDILITRAGPRIRVGVCCLVRNTRSKLINCDKAYRIKVNKSIISPEYFELVLNTPIYQDEIEKMKSGISDSGLNLTQKAFLQISIPVPPLEEQNLIIQEIEQRLSVADKMEQSITESLQKAEALRQSILKKAFSGELVKEVKDIEVPKIKNEYFHQLQLVALVINGFKKQKIDHGEMTLAKNLYLLDSVYKIPTGFKYDRWHLGPYPPALKKVVNNKEYFKRSELFIEATNDDKLLKYINPYLDEVNAAIGDLSAIFSKYKGAERSHKTELLATVCKVIEDIKSTDLSAVRQSMEEWKIDLKTSKFKNKAEKFNEPETKKCIEFIVERGWDRKLI